VHFGAIPDRRGEPALIADANATRQILGWEPRWTLLVGLMETIAWYKETIVDQRATTEQKRCA
jgi:nucleoside-diphosphate-sugar epimerase